MSRVWKVLLVAWYAICAFGVAYQPPPQPLDRTKLPRCESTTPATEWCAVDENEKNERGT